jgi:hypothetical protein
VVEVAEVGGVDHAGVGAEGVLGAVEVEVAYIFSNHKDGEYDHYLLPIFFCVTLPLQEVGILLSQVF